FQTGKRLQGRGRGILRRSLRDQTPLSIARAEVVVVDAEALVQALPPRQHHRRDHRRRVVAAGGQSLGQRPDLRREHEGAVVAAAVAGGGGAGAGGGGWRGGKRPVRIEAWLGRVIGAAVSQRAKRVPRAARASRFGVWASR